MTLASISQGTRMGLAPLFAPALGASVMTDVAPIVFVVDGDVTVRESLQLLVHREGWQPRAFSSAQEFFARPPVSVPNCLILDVSFADLDGLDVQRRASLERPEMPIIFITGHGDVRTTVQAMKAGAFEFLIKPFRDEVILCAIRDALECSRVALGREAEMSVLRNCYASLSPRERQVMGLVVSGFLNKQVGGELGISEITVKAHRGKVMLKMKADSLPALVKMSGKLGLALSEGWRSGQSDSKSLISTVRIKNARFS
jgi:FixJ family two-component response regulator